MVIIHEQKDARLAWGSYLHSIELPLYIRICLDLHRRARSSQRSFCRSLIANILEHSTTRDIASYASLRKSVRVYASRRCQQVLRAKHLLTMNMHVLWLYYMCVHACTLAKVNARAMAKVHECALVIVHLRQMFQWSAHAIGEMASFTVNLGFPRRAQLSQCLHGMVERVHSHCNNQSHMKTFRSSQHSFCRSLNAVTSKDSMTPYMDSYIETLQPAL